VAKAKNKDQLRRRGPTRAQYDRVLIVCEGSKTEPNYLREMVSHHRLSTANIEITGDGGSAPKSVVEYALELFENDPDYDSVFCVFDCDGHPTYQQALTRIRDKTLIRRNGKLKIGEARFEAITSVPCFEYWILLHYKYTTAHMSRYADLEPRLKAIPELATYAKGRQGLFSLTEIQLNTALKNADRANSAAVDAGTDNPTTSVPILIRYLQELATKKV
jgi:hypothetical protein